MEKLIQIIHPYTYKIRNKTNVIGPIDEFLERDTHVRDFVRSALARNVRVLHQRHTHPDSLEGAMSDVAFTFDPTFSFLFDKRILSCITTIYGTPIMDARPKKVSAKEWKMCVKLFISHSALKEMTGTPSEVFFIGGIFENCLANAAAYHAEHYRSNGESLWYLPELCVSLDSARIKETEKKLQQGGIRPLSYEEALKHMV